MPESRFECPRCQNMFVMDGVMDGVTDGAMHGSSDAAFVECPSCGALALPAGDVTDGDPAPGRRTSTASSDADAPCAPLRPAPSSSGVFAHLLDDSTSMPSVEQRSVIGSARAPALDGDLELPAAQRQVAAEPSSSSSAPPPFAHSLDPEALAALAKDAEAGPTNPGAWGSSTLSEEAFGDLEKAFDEMALRPPAAGSSRGSFGVDEERFLRGDDGRGALRVDDSSVRKKPPPLRAGGEESTRRLVPPPPKRPGAQAREKSARRSTHFQLSDEAKRLAFVPELGEKRPDHGGSAGRPRMESPSSPAVPRSERVDRVARERPPAGRALEDVDRDRQQRARVRKPVPSSLQGLSILRAVAIIAVCGILGGVGGALSAPKATITPRTRAELHFADGNRFYDAQRFDDALGAFRVAISIDPTRALVHRAIGAALAKLNRYDEAVAAYEEYLRLEPSAIDVDDVKAALAHRQGARPPRASTATR